MGTRGINSQVQSAVEACFLRIRGDRSVDDVIIDDELNALFLRCVALQLGPIAAPEVNWILMNLRKRGAPHLAGARRRIVKHEAYRHAAEIAARFMEDKHSLTLDRVLCDPVKRIEFDQIATTIAPDISVFELRRSALNLRKSRRLRPELLKKVLDPVVTSALAVDILADPTVVSDGPGIYLFRDQSGVLYLGEASRLRRRVLTHLDHSDRKSLARYLWDNDIQKIEIELHSFASPGPCDKLDVRRAYEAELIRSRNPRFNLQGR